MRVDLCERPRCTSLGVSNGQRSLLSSVKSPYLFDVFRPGEGQVLLTKKMTLYTGYFKVDDVTNNSIIETIP